MKMTAKPNYDAMELHRLNIKEMILLASIAVFAERDFFADANDLFEFAVRNLEDNDHEPWFVDHTLEDNAPAVLIYRRQEHVATSPALLTIKELVA